MTAESLIVRAAVAIVAALLVTAASASAASSLTIKLNSQHRSGVSATATLAAKDGATIVTVRVSGKRGTTYFPDIRRGTCARAATTPEIPLAVVSTNAPAETVIDLKLTQLTAASYVVMLHPSDGTLSSLAPDAAVACGQIRANAGPGAVANAAPVTGIRASLPAKAQTPLALALLASAGGTAFAARRLSLRGRSP